MGAYSILQKSRAQSPLVHHITNWVTIYDCAAAARAVGALPVMAHAIEESGEMAGISNALVLNIGTLTPELVYSMISAAKAANSKGIPVILDAVGAGATALRTQKAREIMDSATISVIKGNKSEIGALAGLDARTRGVESGEVALPAEEIALMLSKSGPTVAITGAVDIVACPKGRVFHVHNGHKMMSEVVGTGCMASSIIGAFCAVESDYAKASAFALSCHGIAGEIAAEQTGAPMAFKSALIDALYSLSEEGVSSLSKVV